jgi:hypothetical protein
MRYFTVLMFFLQCAPVSYNNETAEMKKTNEERYFFYCNRRLLTCLDSGRMGFAALLDLSTGMRIGELCCLR